MSQTKPDQARLKLRKVSPPQESRFLAYNQTSLLRKASFLFSILAMGFLFQNCSSGGGGTGGGSGSGDGPNSDESSGPPQPVECREGFVGIPNNSVYDTGDFCVMKFEAKDDGSGNAISKAAGAPWANINRADAIVACENSGYQLITNDHWQTIARNIELVDKNWSGGQVGNDDGLNAGVAGTSGAPREAAGDDDPCFNSSFPSGASCGPDTWHWARRTHTLSNGEVIWDFAGNAREWVRDDVTGSYGASSRILTITATTHTVTSSLSINGTLGPARNAREQFGPSREYSELNPTGVAATYGARFGVLYPLAQGNGIVRGGNLGVTSSVGIFSAGGFDPSATRSVTGFRCVTSPD